MTAAMTRRVSDYFGKPIVSADRGEKMGTVADVLVDAPAGRMVGLIVSGGLLASEQVLPYSDVQVLGDDAVIVKSLERIVSAREWHEAGSDATRSNTYKDKRVVTAGGRELGKVSDVYVNEHTGLVEGYDVAAPGFGKLIQTRSVLPHSPGVTVGPDLMVVSEEAASDFENQATS